MKIVIASGKGGVGKSMLTSALAMLFAKNQKVVAVDCDVDAPNLAIWLGGVKRWDKTLPVVTSAKPEIDLNKCNSCGICVENCKFEAMKMVNKNLKLNPFLCEGCGACEIICPVGAIKLKPVQNGEIKIKKTKYSFPLISGQLYPGESGSGKVVTEIKKEAEKFKQEVMLIDSAPGTGCPVIASLQGANFAILVTEPTPSGFTDLKRVLEVVNHFNISYGVVINKWDIYKNLSQKIEKWAGRKFLGKISFDKEIFKAVANLKPILKTNLRVKKEIKEIFKNLYQLW
ncbi:ATP-binding protein [Patescibacteria group bacterium]|nr:ATP-binding protein [Patescibacteria group bacterium]